ncbi:MAG: hypothetical protein HY694_03745 [Deltaproteobacteria bacterium]|nr:hypothetical protein [Deltaproteobacteria bacterium]
MNLIIWTYIFGGATVFGFIVGVFSVWNGRMTRRELREVIERGDQRTHELLERMNGRMDRTAQFMEEMDQRHTALLGRIDSHMQEMDQRHTALLERIDSHMQEMDRRHTELLSQVLKRAS